MESLSPVFGMLSIPTNNEIFAYFDSHWLFFALVIMLLRGISKVSPWKWDEAIVEVIAQMFAIVAPKSKKS
jgi:hypothetical protein